MLHLPVLLLVLHHTFRSWNLGFAIDFLSVEDVTKLVHDLALLETDDKLLHQLFIIQPGKTRSFPTVGFASPYILHKLVAALEGKVSNAAQVLRVFKEWNHDPDTMPP